MAPERRVAGRASPERSATRRTVAKHAVPEGSATRRTVAKHSVLERPVARRSVANGSSQERPVTRRSAPDISTQSAPRLAVRAGGRDSLLVVGISELIVNSAGKSLVTYALGSCVGIVGFDEARGVAGLLHILLPSSNGDVAAAAQKPATFADTGVPALVLAMERLGANARTSRFHIAGGASVLQTSGSLDVGRRNILAVRKALWKAGLLVAAEAVGGREPRTLSIAGNSGVVRVQSPGKREVTL